MDTVHFKISDLHEIGTAMLRNVAAICEKKGINYSLFYGSMLGAVRHHGPIPWDYDIDIIVHENDMERFIAAMENELPEEYWVDFRSKYDTPKCIARIGLRGYDTHSLHIDVFRMVGFPDSFKAGKQFNRFGRFLLELRIVKDANLAYYSGTKLKKLKIYRKILLPISTNMIVRRFDALCKKYPYEKANKVGVNVCPDTMSCIYDKQMIDDTILVDYDDFKVRIPRDHDRILRELYGDYMKYPPKEKTDAAISRDYVLHKVEMN